MEKVWFKLRQTDYPPEDADSIGTGKETGPICLGHFIPDLERLDFPLNRGEIEEFPAHMNVYHTNSLNFEWRTEKEANLGAGVGAGAPIATTAGVVLKASVQSVFRREVKSWETYDRLDTYIVQPDKVYVAECLEGESLSSHVQNRSSWSMFMITGVKVARTGERAILKPGTRGIRGDFEIDFPGNASGKANLDAVHKRSQQLKGSHVSDFVWAVRLAKVSKGLLMRDWSLKPCTKRATFRTEKEEEVDIISTVAAETRLPFDVSEDEDLNEGLVILNQNLKDA